MRSDWQCCSLWESIGTLEVAPIEMSINSKQSQLIERRLIYFKTLIHFPVQYPVVVPMWNVVNIEIYDHRPWMYNAIVFNCMLCLQEGERRGMKEMTQRMRFFQNCENYICMYKRSNGSFAIDMGAVDENLFERSRSLVSHLIFHFHTYLLSTIRCYFPFWLFALITAQHVILSLLQDIRNILKL